RGRSPPPRERRAPSAGPTRAPSARTTPRTGRRRRRPRGPAPSRRPRSGGDATRRGAPPGAPLPVDQSPSLDRRLLQRTEEEVIGQVPEDADRGHPGDDAGREVKRLGLEDQVSESPAPHDDLGRDQRAPPVGDPQPDAA